MNNFVPMIEHEGIIEQIEGNTAHVRISISPACASCLAKGACEAAGEAEKYLDVPVKGAHYQTGERVHVQVSKRLGMRAVALGYVYPMLLLVAVLAILVSAGANELTAAGLALASLLPYYLVLYMARKRIEHRFTFSMTKSNAFQ